MNSRRIKLNLFLVSFSFLLNMGAYFSLEGLQSSLNKDAGTASLSALYSAYVVTSLFLPTLALEFLQSKTAIGCATLAYAVYTIANYYPRPYTLIPAAAILGSGSSVLWSSKRVFVSDLAVLYSHQNKLDENKTTQEFFGIFWGIFSLSMLIGNAASSAAIQNLGTPSIPDSGPLFLYNSSSWPTITTTLVTSDETVILKCAMHNCEVRPTIENATEISAMDMEPAINTSVMQVLFGVFVGLQITAALIMFIFVDDPPRKRNFSKTPEESHLLKEMDRNTEGDKKLPDEKEDSSHPKKVSEGADKNTSTTTKQPSVCARVLKQVLATVRFMTINHTAKLLIPITIHAGVLQAFLFGQFTKYWVTCVLGIQYVGYVASLFGLGSTIAGYGTGMLTKVARRWAIMAAAMVLESGLCAFLIIWEPEIFDSSWLFFIVSFVFGILHAIHKTILTTIYTIFFPVDKEAASAAASIWDPLGTSVAYAVSTQICNKLFVGIMIGLAGVGTIMYFIAEASYNRMQERRNKQDRAEEAVTLVTERS